MTHIQKMQEICLVNTGGIRVECCWRWLKSLSLWIFTQFTLYTYIINCIVSKFIFWHNLLHHPLREKCCLFVWLQHHCSFFPEEDTYERTLMVDEEIATIIPPGHVGEQGMQGLWLSVNSSRACLPTGCLVQRGEIVLLDVPDKVDSFFLIKKHLLLKTKTVVRSTLFINELRITSSSGSDLPLGLLRNTKCICFRGKSQ